jgi:hypothetical protein
MTPDSPRHAGAPRRVLSIAWREFRTTVLTKGFLFSALVFPLLMAGVSLLLPILMATSVQPMQGAILVDAPAAATDELRAELGRAAKDPAGALRERAERGEEPELEDATAALTPIESSVEPIAADAVEGAKERVRRGDALALVIIPPASLDAQSKDPTYELFVATRTSPKHTAIVNRAAREAIVRLRVQASGADYQRTMDLLKRPEASILRLTEDGPVRPGIDDVDEFAATFGEEDLFDAPRGVIVEHLRHPAAEGGQLQRDMAFEPEHVDDGRADRRRDPPPGGSALCGDDRA